MNNDPAATLILIASSAYYMLLWLNEFKSNIKSHQETTNIYPGTTMCNHKAVLISAAGAIIILSVETMGEITLNIKADQSHMTWLLAAYTINAAFIEEVIFRGILIFNNQPPKKLYTGIITISLIFSLLHPFLFKFDMGNEPTWKIILLWNWCDWIQPQLTMKSWFSFFMVFTTSIWLYYCRIAKWNKHQSLLPCFAAHVAKNIGVISVKFAQGFVSGLW